MSPISLFIINNHVPGAYLYYIVSIADEDNASCHSDNHFNATEGKSEFM